MTFIDSPLVCCLLVSIQNLGSSRNRTESRPLSRRARVKGLEQFLPEHSKVNLQESLATCTTSILKMFHFSRGNNPKHLIYQDPSLPFWGICACVYIYMYIYYITVNIYNHLVSHKLFPGNPPRVWGFWLTVMDFTKTNQSPSRIPCSALRKIVGRAQLFGPARPNNQTMPKPHWGCFPGTLKNLRTYCDTQE